MWNLKVQLSLSDDYPVEKTVNTEPGTRGASGWICNDLSLRVAVVENLTSHNGAGGFRNAPNMQLADGSWNPECSAALGITGPSCGGPEVVSKQETEELRGFVLRSHPWTT